MDQYNFSLEINSTLTCNADASQAICGNSESMDAIASDSKSGGPSFLSLCNEEMADFICAHQEEMDASGICKEEVLTALGSGKAVLEARYFGFAMVQLKRLDNGKAIPQLWLLYVMPAMRGNKICTKFVRELLRKFADDYHMSLYCKGAQRRRFFGRAGFVVEKREGELRCMTTQRDFRQYL